MMLVDDRNIVELRREQMRAELTAYIERCREQTQGRFQIVFPVDTERAFLLIGTLGYKVSRKWYDYAVARRDMEPVRTKDHRLVWSIENVLDLALQCERLRLFAYNQHNDMKTCFEREAERDAMMATGAAGKEAIGMSLRDILCRIVKEPTEVMRRALGEFVPIKAFENGYPLPTTQVDEDLLENLVGATDETARSGYAAALYQRMKREVVK